MIQNDTTTH